MIPFKSMEQLEIEGWSPEQLHEQHWALREGVDISMLKAAKWDDEQMSQQRKALADGLALVERTGR